jgi:hypothetical protein
MPRTLEQIAADAKKAKARFSIDEVTVFSLIEDLATEVTELRRNVEELRPEPSQSRTTGRLSSVGKNGGL